MKVLITGGAGFIGSHVACRLLERGDTVVVLDDFNSFVYDAHVKEERIQHMFSSASRPRVLAGSILDRQLVDTVFREEDFDAVLHLAAHANPALSVQAAEAYTAVNVLGTLVILEAAANYEIPRFIFASSSSVYDDETVPFNEAMYPLRPRSPYGASKASAEVYCAMWHELYALPVTILRFFSVYGPWGRPDMMPAIFTDALLHSQQLIVTEDRQRDFTYIDDIVDGILATLGRQFEYEVINLGCGRAVGLLDFVAALEKAVGHKAQVVMRSAPLGEMRITYADISKAQHLLGYAPRISVDEGTKRLVEWMRKRVR